MDPNEARLQALLSEVDQIQRVLARYDQGFIAIKGAYIAAMVALATGDQLRFSSCILPWIALWGGIASGVAEYGARVWHWAKWVFRSHHVAAEIGKLSGGAYELLGSKHRTSALLASEPTWCWKLATSRNPIDIIFWLFVSAAIAAIFGFWPHAMGA